MTHRIVVFIGRSGWFMTPEFVGDKKELEQFRGGERCDQTWTQISRKFSSAKTLLEFKEVSDWAQAQYHGQQSTITPPILYHLPASVPDEMFLVYEDLAVTGISSLGQCPFCGRAYPVHYLPDGSVKSPGIQCLTCGTTLREMEELPTRDMWGQALELYHSEPASLCISSEVGHRDPVAAAHVGQPVKIQKLLTYECGKFRYEVLFRDWQTAKVSADELSPTDPQAQPPSTEDAANPTERS